jgi:hypothetical protein
MKRMKTLREEMELPRKPVRGGNSRRGPSPDTRHILL